MRSSMKKQHVAYLVELLTHHIESLPDDMPRWVQCLKLAYRELVTLDNMGIFELDHEASVITLDRIYENLRNEFGRNDLFFPRNSKYYD